MGNQQITDAGLIGLGKHPELLILVLYGRDMKLTAQSIDRISEQFLKVTTLGLTASVPLSLSTYEKTASIKSLSDVSIGNLNDQQIVPFRGHPAIKS